MRVNIFDREYNLRANEDDEYLKEIVSYVDEKVRGIASSALRKDKEEVSILTCLNIADELYKEREKNIKAKERIQQLIGKVKKEAR